MEFLATIFFIVCCEVLTFGIFRKMYFISVLNILLVFLYLVLPYIINYTTYNKFDLVSYPDINEQPSLKYHLTVVFTYLLMNASFYSVFFYKRRTIAVNRKVFEFSRPMYIGILAISLVFYCAYISSVGFIGSLSSGFDIRSGEVDLGAGGVAVRMLPITATFMMFLLYERVVLRNSSKKILLYIYGVIFLLWTLSTAGRSAVLMPILTVALAYFLYIRTHKIKIKTKQIIGGVFAFMFLVLFALYGKTFFTVLPFIIQMNFSDVVSNLETYRELNSLDNLNLFSNLVKEYGHAYYTLDSLIKHPYHEYLYFRDVIDAIKDYVPERLVNINIELNPSVSRINTIRLFDGFDAASYPPGFIGFFYYSLGIPGVAIGALIIGTLTATLNRYYIKFRQSNPYAIIWTSVLLLTFVFYFVNADVRVFSRDAFFSIAVVLLLLQINKIRLVELRIGDRKPQD